MAKAKSTSKKTAVKLVETESKQEVTNPIPDKDYAVGCDNPDGDPNADRITAGSESYRDDDHDEDHHVCDLPKTRSTAGEKVQAEMDPMEEPQKVEVKEVKEPKTENNMKAVDTEFFDTIKVGKAQAAREEDFAKCKVLTLDGTRYFGAYSYENGVHTFSDCLQLKPGMNVGEMVTKWFAGKTSGELEEFTTIGQAVNATISPLQKRQKVSVAQALIAIRSRVKNLKNIYTAKVISNDKY